MCVPILWRGQQRTCFFGFDGSGLLDKRLLARSMHVNAYERNPKVRSR